MIILLRQAHSGEVWPHDVWCCAHSSVVLSCAEWKLKWRAADQERSAEACWILHLHRTDPHRQCYRLCQPGCQGWVVSDQITVHIHRQLCIWNVLKPQTTYLQCQFLFWTIAWTHCSLSKFQQFWSFCMRHLCIFCFVYGWLENVDVS